MKAEILKIAGVKDLQSFYKKFPTEESFMKAHSKDLEKIRSKRKKAQSGLNMDMNAWFNAQHVGLDPIQKLQLSPSLTSSIPHGNYPYFQQGNNSYSTGNNSSSESLPFF